VIQSWAEESKSGYNRNSQTHVHHSAIHNSQAVETTQCPTTKDWIKKMWYMYTMEFYLSIRNNDMWFEGKWMQLEDIMVSKVSQAQKGKGHMFSLICGR
jgi:hypothetical protein